MINVGQLSIVIFRYKAISFHSHSHSIYLYQFDFFNVIAEPDTFNAFLGYLIHRVITKFSERPPFSGRKKSWEGSLSQLGSTICPVLINKKQTLPAPSQQGGAWFFCMLCFQSDKTQIRYHTWITFILGLTVMKTDEGLTNAWDEGYGFRQISDFPY